MLPPQVRKKHSAFRAAYSKQTCTHSCIHVQCRQHMQASPVNIYYNLDLHFLTKCAIVPNTFIYKQNNSTNILHCTKTNKREINNPMETTGWVYLHSSQSSDAAFEESSASITRCHSIMFATGLVPAHTTQDISLLLQFSPENSEIEKVFVFFVSKFHVIRGPK